MTDFTPGPWSLDEFGGVIGNEHRVASITACTVASGDQKEVWANAALIAAAPEMYEALISILAYGVSDKTGDEVRATIKKANGG